MRAFRTGISLLVVVLALSCSDSTTAPTIEATTFSPTLGVDLAASTKTTSGLYYRDTEVGTGTVIGTGHRLTVHYTGCLSDASLFDSNQPPATPFTFVVGTSQVIKGWDQGVLGMRVGGTRQLIIPPSLGYGSNDYLDIPANSVLVFSVRVLSAQ